MINQGLSYTPVNHSVTITNGWANLSGNLNHFLEYGALNGEALGGSQGCVKFKIRFGYTGAPGLGNPHMILSAAASSMDHSNYFSLIHGTDGAITLTLFTSTGGALIFEHLGLWTSNVANIPYEFLIDWDVINGKTRLFIDGTQFGDQDCAEIPHKHQLNNRVNPEPDTRRLACTSSRSAPRSRSTTASAW